MARHAQHGMNSRADRAVAHASRPVPPPAVETAAGAAVEQAARLATPAVMPAVGRFAFFIPCCALPLMSCSVVSNTVAPVVKNQGCR